MSSGPDLKEFKSELDTASGHIGEVRDGVTSGREGAEDIRWAVGTFGRVEQKAGEVADIIGGFADVLDLLGKVGPLGRVFRPLERVLEDIEDAVKKVETKAGEIDRSTPVQDVKSRVDDAIVELTDLEADVGRKRAEFDERREPVQGTIDALDFVAMFDEGLADDIGTPVDQLVSPPRDAARELNQIFDDSVSGNLQDFNEAVADNPLRTAQQMEKDLCTIVDQLGFLSEPFDILDSVLRPVRWALDASDFVFDTVVSPILDPILDAIGVNKLFDGIRDTLSGLLPDIDVLDAFDDNRVLEDLQAQLAPPDVGLGEFLDLEGPESFLAKAREAIDPTNFSNENFVTGTDGDDSLGDASADAKKQVISGGAGNDTLQGGGDRDIFRGGAGDDIIDGGVDATSGDIVAFSGAIGEYLIEYSEDGDEVIVSHVDPAGLIGDGTDRIRNVETFAFTGLQITEENLRNGLQLLDEGVTGSVNGIAPTEDNPEPRDFLIASAAGDSETQTGIVLNGGEGDDHLIGTAYGDNLNGGPGNDVLDPGSGPIIGIGDNLNGGFGIDEATFASSLREEGERFDLGLASGDRSDGLFLPTVTASSIERVEGSDFDDVIFGRETQDIDGDAANGTYVERLAGGGGSDLLRGFGSDDRLEGGAGGDILIGDGGVNQYLGGADDDVLVLDPTAPGQQIDGGTGFDALVYGSFPSIVSTFDSDKEGWTVDSGDLDQNNEGGQPEQGGRLTHKDVALGVQDFLSAPDKFLGNQAQMFGGRISFDLFAGFPSFWESSLGVVLEGGAGETTAIEADVYRKPGTKFHPFEFALDDRGSWRTQSGTEGLGGFATDAVIQNVLSDLTAVKVYADHFDRDGRVETTRLDNFVLSALPVKEPVVSHFEGGTLEGWTAVLRSDKKLFGTETLGGPDDLEWRPSGGTAGAYMEVTNNNDSPWFVAPGSFLGDQSDKLGGRIEYAIRQVTGGDLDAFDNRSEVALVGGDLQLVHNQVRPPPDNGMWFRTAVVLDHDRWGVLKEDSTTRDVTPAEFASVLSDLDGLYIRGGFKAGPERIGLDEVRLAPPSDGIAASALDVAAQTFEADPVSSLSGRIDVNAADGTVTRFDGLASPVADSFTGVEAIVGRAQGDRFNGVLEDADATIAMAGAAGDDMFTIGTGRQIVEAGPGADTVVATDRNFSRNERYEGGVGLDTLDLSQVTDARWRLDMDGQLRGGDWTLSDAELQGTLSAKARGFERILLGAYDDRVVTTAVSVTAGAGNDHVSAGNVAGQVLTLGTGDDVAESFSPLGGQILLGLGNDTALVAGGRDGAVMAVIGGPEVALDPEGEVLSDDDVFVLGSGRVNVIGGDGQDIVSYALAELIDPSTPVTVDLSDDTQNANGAAGLTQTGVENASGGVANDILRGDAAGNLLVGGDGDDTLDGEGVGVDPDAIDAEEAGDVLYGNAGDDRLRGEVGEDVLHGGSGTNILEGGPGKDTASFSFTQVDAVGRDGVVQTHDPALVARTTATTGPSGAGEATRTRILHQDDFERGVAGYVNNRFPQFDRNFEATFPGTSTILGPLDRGSTDQSEPNLAQKTFDLGPDYAGPITVSFDFIEFDNWDGTELITATPAGDVKIAFTNGTPAATSGTSSGVSWTVATDQDASADIGLGDEVEHQHRITLTFTPQDRSVPLAFGPELGRPSDDRAGIDNLLITAVPETDTLSDIENLTGGALADMLVGNGLDNVLNGAAGDDTLDGRDGDDNLLDGDGRDIVRAGPGNDTVLAGQGSDDGHGDSYDGGAGIDVLDYSGFGSDVTIGSGSVTTSYQVERPVWAGATTEEEATETRTLEDGKTYLPHDIAQALDPALADSADDFFRDLSGISDPEDLIATEVVDVTAQDSHTGFEAAIGTAFDDILLASGSLSRLEGGEGDDRFLNVGLGDVVVGGTGTDRVTLAVSDESENLTLNLLTGEASGLGNGWSGVEIVSGVLGTGDDVVIAAEVFDSFDGNTGTDLLTLDYSAGEGDRFSLDTGDLQGTNFSYSIGGSVLGSGAISRFEGFDITGTSGNDDINIDTATEASRLSGGAGSDRLTAGKGNDSLDGGAGADDLNGGFGQDTASYAGSSGGVSVRLWQGSGSRADAAGDTLASIENLTGSAHDDTLAGDGGANLFEGGAGADALNGGFGQDTASYAGSSGGVSVRLWQGSGSRADAAGDTLASIENLTGSAHDDTLAGDGGANLFEGGAGADALNGGFGQDTASYAGSSGGVSVRLWQGSGSRADAAGDTLASIENLTGSAHDDTLAGDGGANLFEGGAGADALNGGFGRDTASYAGSDGGVSVRLWQGKGGLADAAGDTLSGIENLTGSAHDDLLVGDAGRNVLSGGDGADRLLGGNGPDVLQGGAGPDDLSGGVGRDTFVFEPGTGVDTITDWQDGTDALDLRALSFADFAAVQGATSQAGPDLSIDLGGGDEALVETFALAAFDSGDVIL